MINHHTSGLFQYFINIIHRIRHNEISPPAWAGSEIRISGEVDLHHLHGLLQSSNRRVVDLVVDSTEELRYHHLDCRDKIFEQIGRAHV